MKKHLILGECKWTRERGKAAILQDLVEKKAPKVVPAAGDWQVFFLGFAREGWNELALEYARHVGAVQPAGPNWHIQGMRLLSLDDVDTDLQAWVRS